MPDNTMKKLLLALALLLAFPALAGTYSITTTTNQDGVLAKAMNRANAATCRYFGQPVGCTQASVRREFCKRNGIGGQPILDENGNQTGTTPLVSDCAGATQFDIYPDVQKFLDKEIVRLVKEEYGPKNAQDDQSAFDAAKAAASQAAKDQACVALGLPPGCLP